ncbi:hypothetical protein CFN78_02525 [Amycolatopsis antarctica]|uniref:DUF4237 domain-containing protein n=1 Tax=Amycolatopsis antarctica TaxID=1854586 RepID=A0A263D9B1_9PSEU|nr:TNT domain-containing protein [Amycolatopsis antarctica]OZM75070.1 hypothetical protein CFN78_02525 [Amycolatopsis antarctica]
MGIELPAELAEVAERTGVSWPRADEDAMRAQATAWREASGGLSALAGEADAVAGQAIAAMDGPAAEAARTRAAALVDPSSGDLSVAAHDAGTAADRLEHAAGEIGAAKVELVRGLVDAARNQDAARAVADAGHPAALLGLDTALSGTAANLGAVSEGLAAAVGPGGASGPPALPVVEANPGTHGSTGQSGLIGAVTGLPAATVEAGLSIAEGAAGAPSTVLGSTGLGSTVEGDAGIVEAPGVPSLPGQAPEHPIGDLGDEAETAVPPGGAPSAGVPSVVDRVLPADGTPPLGFPVPAAADQGTGPIALGPAGAPTSYRGLLAGNGFDDAPTPAAGVPLSPYPGQTTAAGFSDAPAPGAAPAVPPAANPVAGQGLPGSPVAQAPFAQAPVAQAPFGQAPFGSAPPAPPGSPAVPAPGGGHGGGAGGGPGGPPPPRQHGAAPRWSPYLDAGPNVPAPPPQPARQERAGAVALFLVHMFPIGHMPVAADRPVRQLPPPAEEIDFAAGLRFPPHDHPASASIDPGAALAAIVAGVRQPPPPPAAVLPRPPAELAQGHDPLGGMHERDWERRYLVRSAAGRQEYAWPPGELYPEGGQEAGEPVLLTEGTPLDRFGDAGGRVFAAAGTPFALRALPSTHLDSGYRRYRVLRELPMWRSVSAGWFAQPGGGLRYRAIYSAAELVNLGYLADTTFRQLDRQEADAG